MIREKATMNKSDPFKQGKKRFLTKKQKREIRKEINYQIWKIKNKR